MKNPEKSSYDNPYKLLGARRGFAALGLGAILGLLVGCILAFIFIPMTANAGEELWKGIVMMGLIFGLLMGPIMTLGFAAKLAVNGFAGTDFTNVGWTRLIIFSFLGCFLGIGSGVIFGFALISIMPMGDAIIFFFAHIGGIFGVLIPVNNLVSKAAKRRQDEVLKEHININR